MKRFDPLSTRWAHSHPGHPLSTAPAYPATLGR
jgi:hypothetical protein